MWKERGCGREVSKQTLWERMGVVIGDNNFIVFRRCNRLWLSVYCNMKIITNSDWGIISKITHLTWKESWSPIWM